MYLSKFDLKTLNGLLCSLLVWVMTTLCAYADDENKKIDYEVREAISYASRESGDLKADLYLPNVALAPAIVLIHGGGWIRGKRTEMNNIAKTLAKHGYAVLNIDYRLAPEHRFPAQIEDCRQAVKWLRDNAKNLGIDANKIGSFGYSAGAHLALLLGVSGDEDTKLKR